jgi:hypothetical protein
LGQTCVLHVYDGNTTIDIFQEDSGVFGILVGLSRVDSEFLITWQDIGPRQFQGVLDKQTKTLHGRWAGGSLCPGWSGETVFRLIQK